MTTSRRTVLAAAGTGLASIPAAAAAACVDRGIAIDADVAKLIKLSEESNAVLMRGEGERYFQMINLTDDFTLMAPFGGKPSRAPYSPEKRAEIGRFFRNGTFSSEVVQAYGTSDMVVLALIERCTAEIGGLPMQDWALRVTLVYRREGAAWRLVHRHADPLANGISLKHAAALGRGEAV
jgi:ketosteroid isomerase-like protein